MAKRILIIDDERDMQVYLGTLFRKAGYETAVAETGEDGVRLAAEIRPQLITLDILMPKQSGVVAYESLRRSADTGTIPIIIVTGLAQHEQLFNFDSVGLPPPDAVVDKPIDREAFLKQVGELIGGPE
jgi:CheY-like chemotaxis protein